MAHVDNSRRPAVMKAGRTYTRAMIRRRVIALFLLAALLLVPWWVMVRMPGKTFRGALPPLSVDELSLREELRGDVQELAGDIGERNVGTYRAYIAAAEFIENAFRGAGLEPRRDTYPAAGRECHNVEAEVRGASDGIVVVGAHYDTVPGCPGANDNTSGVASMLALARRFAGRKLERTVRFVAFANEEPGFFHSAEMGSWVYASRCRAKNEPILAMISLETVGYFSQKPGSQKYPAPGLGLLYPSEGNFIAFVGNVASRDLVRQTVGSFRQHASFPSEGTALPSAVPGIDWSDHWSFWQHGYPALMVTDTAPFRYPHYHEPTDTPDKLDYDSMARVVAGLEKVIADLASKD